MPAAEDTPHTPPADRPALTRWRLALWTAAGMVVIAAYLYTLTTGG